MRVTRLQLCVERLDRARDRRKHHGGECICTGACSVIFPSSASMRVLSNMPARKPRLHSLTGQQAVNLGIHGVGVERERVCLSARPRPCSRVRIHSSALVADDTGPAKCLGNIGRAFTAGLVPGHREIDLARVGQIQPVHQVDEILF